MAGGRPIEISIGTDVSDVLSGTERVAQSFENIQDTLTDVADASSDTDRAMTRAMDNVADSGTDAARQVDRDLTQALDNVADQAQTTGDSVSRSLNDAGDGVSDGMQRGTREAGEGLSNLRDEAAGTATEAAASFDGSAESIAGAFQEVAASAFAGFGPLGAAAGLAAAAGIGLIVTKMQEASEASDALQQDAIDMIDSIAEADGNLAKINIADRIKKWGRELVADNPFTFWIDETSTKYEQVAEDAKRFGVTAEKAHRAAGGSISDAREFLAETADDYQRLNKVVEEGTYINERGVRVMSDSAKGAKERRDALSDMRGEAENNIKTQEKSMTAYEMEEAAIAKTTEEVEKRAEAEEKAREEFEKSLEARNKIGDVNRSVTDSENAWHAALAENDKALAENGRNVDMHTEKGRDNRAMLVEVANAGGSVLKSYYDQGMGADELAGKVQGVKDAFMIQADAAGYSREEAEKLFAAYYVVPAEVSTKILTEGGPEAKAAIEGIPAVKDTTVKVGTDGVPEAQGEIVAVEGTEATIEVKDDGTIESVQKRIDGIQGRDLVKIDVDDDFSVKATQERIDGIHGKDVPIRVYIDNASEFAAQMNALTANRSMTITVNKELGQGSGI